MSIGKRIKDRRKELNLSVDDIAEKLGKNRATIYRYESNDIENLPITILEPLSEALKTTPAYLMGWDDLPNTKTMNTPDNIIPQEALAIYDSIDDKEILTLAAHRSGYEGELSEEELDDIKLAIKVALARHNKI